MKRLDLIGIGECLVEFNHLGNGQYQIGYSGDVLNALAAARRLGLRTGLISALGNDPFFEGLRETLTSERIDLSHAPVLGDRPNGIYFIYLNESGIPAFHFLRKNSAARETFARQPLEALIDYVREARALLFSSIPLAVMHEREKLFALLDAVRGETVIAFDLNVRKSLWEDLGELRGLLDRLAAVVDVIFVTDDDDAMLFGDRAAERAIEEYGRKGFRQVVLRRGAFPTMVSSEGEIFEVPVPHVTNIVDTTGAGDAFNAGFIAARLLGHPAYECAAMGNAAAAASIETRGGRGTGVTIERVEKLYRPLVKWGTFHGPRG